jgi:hypothetical protein
MKTLKSQQAVEATPVSGSDPFKTQVSAKDLKRQMYEGSVPTQKNSLKNRGSRVFDN